MSSYAIGFNKNIASKELYDEVLNGLGETVLMGPFKATSGISCLYYLNMGFLLSKLYAPQANELIGLYLNNYIKEKISKKIDLTKNKVLSLGIECAGGMITSQLASIRNKELFSWMDFSYFRKEKKKTGTCQQIEGPKGFTGRTKDSPLIYALWVDDCLSTGSSLKAGIKYLKENFNIEVIGAFFLTDRSSDRKNCKVNHLDSIKDDVEIFAIYDLKEIDKVVMKNIEKK